MFSCGNQNVFIALMILSEDLPELRELRDCRVPLRRSYHHSRKEEIRRMKREGGVYMSASKPQKAEKEHDELSSRFISDSPFLVFIYFFSIVTTLMPKIEVKTNLKLKTNEKKNRNGK